MSGARPALPWLLLATVARLGGCAWITEDDLSMRRDPDADGYLGAGAPGDEDCAPFDPTLPRLWYADSDGDGHGVDETTVACSLPAGYAQYTGDCNDLDPTIYPGGEERCDDADADEDCNGLSDDADQGIEDAALTIWYRDQDGDGYGVAGQTMGQCEQPDGYVADPTDCNDANAEAHPGATEACGDGIDVDCDGTAAPECPVEGGINADDVTAIYSCTTAGRAFGTSLAIAGDVTGDLRADLIVGVPSTGAAEFYVVPGGAANTDITLHPEWLHSIRGSGAANISHVVDGSAVTSVGAILVGVYTEEASGATTGVATWTVLSTMDLESLDNSGVRPSFAGAPGDGSGRDPAVVGDLDYDGTADILIGASAHDESGNGNPGAAFIVWGDPAGAPPLVDGASTAPIVRGDDDGDQMGAALGVADVTGDGLDDLIAGAPGASDDVFLDMGTLSVFAGPIGRNPDNLGAPDLYLMGGSNGATFADRGAIATGVDVDGDGISDMLVGGTDHLVQASWATSSPGRASIILGGATTASGLGDIYATYAGVHDRDMMAARVLFAGDLDGDTHDDLVLASPYDDRTDIDAAEPEDGDNAGSVYVFAGPLSPGNFLVTDTPTVWMGSASDALATGLAAGMDLTGDSLLDLVIGAPGRDGGMGEIYVMKPFR